MRDSRVWPRATAVTFALTAMAGLFLSPGIPALAHNVVEERIPVPDSLVTQSPVDISIATDGTFLDLGGEGRGFAIVVRDVNGLYFGDGCLDLREGRMTASAALGKAGVYEVAYQFVSADGHSLSESYEFTFAPEGEYAIAPGYQSPPECGVEPLSTTDAAGTTNAPAEPQATDPVSAAEASPNGWVIGAGIAATIAALALLVMIRQSSRRTNQQ